ncbi:MAG TPA: hypothetical protein VMU84_00675 [Thermoanaerobaculia bacterium]|nr:hypothetical protein [Thermoanaerobaculia bacterium]
MCRTIELRHVEESEYATWEAAASRAGVPLSEYLLRQLRWLDGSMPHKEFMRFLRRRETEGPKNLTSAEIIREMRGPIGPDDDD